MGDDRMNAAHMTTSRPLTLADFERTQAGEPRPGMALAMDGLADELARNSKLVGELEGRLAPVLAPDPPRPADGEKAVPLPTLSPLADCVHDRAKSLRDLNDRLAAVLRRIDL
jgi:hypothetical protein